MSEKIDIKTHWRKLSNPNYIGAYSLDPGSDLILTIKNVKNELVIGTDGKKEECIVVYFSDNDKPMILNSTNAKTIAKLYKSPYIEDWSNRKIQLYVDKIKAFGELVEALRIRPFIPKQVEAVKNELINCADCGKQIVAFGNMDAKKMADYTYSKYGKSVCSECATILAKKNVEPIDVLKGEENENN